MMTSSPMQRYWGISYRSLRNPADLRSHLAQTEYTVEAAYGLDLISPTASVILRFFDELAVATLPELAHVEGKWVGRKRNARE